MLADLLSRYWWMTLLRGVVWILFGIVMYTSPAISLVALAVTFGVIALVDGVGAVISAIDRRHERENWWALLISGLAGIALGLITLARPGITTLGLLFYVAIWAIATGLLEIVAAFRLRKEITGEFWLALAGVVSIVFGLFLIARPGEGALSVLWVIATYSIIFGLTLMALAFKTRSFVKRVATAARVIPPRPH